MELFGWFGLVVFFSLWFSASSADITRRKFLFDLQGASPVLMEISYWDVVLYVWVVFSIFYILSMSMARSKNTGKGKAPSSSMERTVKKRKFDTSHTVKKGKGKRRDSSFESEEVPKSDDEEI